MQSPFSQTILQEDTIWRRQRWWSWFGRRCWHLAGSIFAIWWLFNKVFSHLEFGYREEVKELKKRSHWEHNTLSNKNKKHATVLNATQVMNAVYTAELFLAFLGSKTSLYWRGKRNLWTWRSMRFSSVSFLVFVSTHAVYWMCWNIQYHIHCW